MKMLRFLGFLLMFLFPFFASADVQVVDASPQTGWVLSNSGAKQSGDTDQQVATLQKQVDYLNQLDLADQMQQLKQSNEDLKTLLQAQAQAIQQLQTQQNALFQKIGATSGAVADSGVQPAATPATAPNTEDSMYQNGVNQIQNKKYDDAVVSMKGYLKKYSSKGHYAANAHFWLGQLYAVSGMKEKAIEELSQVVNNYSDSAKAPDALLKLGEISYNNNQLQEAEQYWQQIMTQYPTSPAARIAAVKLENIKGSI